MHPFRLCFSAPVIAPVAKLTGANTTYRAAPVVRSPIGNDWTGAEQLHPAPITMHDGSTNNEFNNSYAMITRLHIGRAWQGIRLDVSARDGVSGGRVSKVLGIKQASRGIWRLHTLSRSQRSAILYIVGPETPGATLIECVAAHGMS